jgi:peptidoglycan/LPS O-acetylase OafA/YrhL
MKQGYIEAAIFVVAAIGAFSFAYYLAQTVGLHPLIVHDVADRQKYWMVAVGCLAFVVIFDAVLFSLIVRKHRRERQAAEAARAPRLG